MFIASLVPRTQLRRFFSTLVVADHAVGSAVSGVTISAINAAKKLNQDVSVLVTGHNVKEISQKITLIDGVKQVYEIDDPKFAHPTADVSAEAILQLQKEKGFTHIVGPVSHYVKDIIPRVAAQLDTQPVSDVTEIKGVDTFVRPVYAGNAMSTVRSKCKVKVLTIRPTAFPSEAGKAAAAAPVTKVEAPTKEPLAKWVKDEVQVSDRPQLGASKTVVSGGRAMKSAENFEGILEPLCKKLNAAMGASRAAVDAGMAPNDMQVGQTGKVVAPDLYIAVGISGAIQHLAGMKDSKTIVAINKDPDAPIFQVADYGLVADLFDAVPDLTNKLPQQK